MPPSQVNFDLDSAISDDSFTPPVIYDVLEKIEWIY